MTTIRANDRVENAPPSRPAAKRSAPPLRRAGNAFVRLLLRSPLHPILSGAVMLVSVRGRVSGREFSLPVQYARAERNLYVWVGGHDRKTWWRNLEGGAPVKVRLAGVDLEGTGEALRGERDGEAVERGLRAYLSRFPAAARAHGITRGQDGTFDAASLAAAVERAVIVRIGLRG
ncbi:MAG: hypothetical protein A2X23_12265 [Chloroflexi bacterium GWC2_73_18]|nr:MAG: hypothetical protein A2X23_12265 [Chloroflexi bacterium GWC2_73_18]